MPTSYMKATNKCINIMHLKRGAKDVVMMEILRKLRMIMPLRHESDCGWLETMWKTSIGRIGEREANNRLAM